MIWLNPTNYIPYHINLQFFYVIKLVVFLTFSFIIVLMNHIVEHILLLNTRKVFQRLFYIVAVLYTSKLAIVLGLNSTDKVIVKQ